MEPHAAEEHPGLCCDCFDLSWGMPLADVNAERVKTGRPPIEKPHPRYPTGGWDVP